MAIEKNQVVHKPGALKQTNKLHKHGKHKSKGAINNATKGKVSVKILSKKHKKELGREARKNKAEQLRRSKRDELLSKKRGLGASNSPFLVCLLPLHKQLDVGSALAILKNCDSEISVTCSDTNVTHINLPRFKQHFSFVVPAIDNEFAILDTLKVCDTVVFLVSAVAGIEFGAEIIDEWGNNLLMTTFGQALPTSCVAVMDLESIHPKKRTDVKQNIQKLITNWLPQEKIQVLDKDVDALNLLRKIGNQKQKSIVYRDRRPHLYAESIEFINDNNSTTGTLKVSGYQRGAPLSVNGLVHIPGLGDFQLSRIECNTIVQEADPNKQESLIRTNEIDEMDGEQTWPNADDYKQADDEQQKLKKRIKKVPTGWSDYQAAWIPDIDAESVSEYDDNDDADSFNDDEMNYSDAKSDSYESDEDDFQTVVTESEIGISDERYDENMDIKGEIVDLEQIKAAKCDAMFPDEVDTPQNIPARVRFQKYRGLESFRTSPWDVKENLPLDYAKIFQFENFDRTKKRILNDQQNISDASLPGWFVTIYVKNIEQKAWQEFVQTKSPCIVYGILPHENKMSVLNVLLKRTNNYDLPIKSKERLIIQCGYRRFIVNPIFSEHTNGNKHKFLRFFQPNTTAVATFFAPIQFPPLPVLCYKEINGQLKLIATGTLLSVNPNRLVIKRIVLSGHLLKVHKRSAVVRFMFFNREDIKYFQPCKLRTKYGRIGHIKEPLGTHGHMKCSFNGQLKSQDTVLLYLYKRVFPKWTYEDCIITCNESEAMQE